MAMATVHVVGAGLAGLAAAVRLRGRRRSRRRCTRPRAGRRPLPVLSTTAALGLVIDNGNHLLLSGNRGGARLPRTHRRAGRRLLGPARRDFPVRRSRRPASAGRCGRTTAVAVVDLRAAPPRAGHARARISRASAPAAGAGRDADRRGRCDCAGPLYERLWRPVLLAALNTEPPKPRRARRAAVCARRWRPAAAPAGRSSRATACRQLSSTRRCATSQRRGATVHSAAGCGRSVSPDAAVERLDFGDDERRALARTTRSCSRCRPGSPPTRARTSRRRRLPRHRQRAFRAAPPAGTAAHLGSSAAPANGCSPSPAACRSQSAPPTASSSEPRESSGARRSGPRSRPHRSCGRSRCRPGRSSRSAGRPSRRRPRRSGATAPAPRPLSAISSSPAIGPRPACRPPSKARFARATPRPPPCSRRRCHGRPSLDGRPHVRHGGPCRPPTSRTSDDHRPTALANSGHSPGRPRALLDAPAGGRPLGLRARGRRDDPGRIRAAHATISASQSTGARGARSPLSAPHPGRRMAAGRCSTTAPST